MGASAQLLDASTVRDAVASLARSLKRVSTYRHAPEQHAGYLEQALLELRQMLEASPNLTLSLTPTGLMYEGELIHSEPVRENNFFFRLYRDGVRTLTFKRGLLVDELVAFAHVAMGDLRSGDREDAVTELWKADLPHVAYSAGAGYRMDESAGDGVSATISGIAARVQATLDKHVGERFVETGQQSLLWNEAQRAKADPQDWPMLASRAGLTVLRIVAEDYAGWDIEALKETFARLADQMLEHQAATPLAQVLAALKTLPGTHGADFRTWMGRWLSDQARLVFAVELPGASRLLPPWLALLPQESGATLLSLLPRAKEQGARDVLAQAILSRIESCSAQVVELLRSGSAAEVRPILAGMSGLATVRRSELATGAFLNRDPAVALEAIPHLAQEPSSAVRNLGQALQHESRAVRIAAASALAALPSSTEKAGAPLIDAITRPRFANADAEEKVIFHRALGKLGSTVGFLYLSSQLGLPPKKIFGRQRRTQVQLLAVEGLAEEGSPRSLRALDDGSSVKRGYSRAVAAACKAAAERVRSRRNS
jgi:hypothetical protein